MINVLGLILTFYASHYSDGIMAQVLHNRQTGNAWVSMPMDLPAHDGLIAVRDCEHLGEVWLLRPAGWTTWERHLVVDCARPPGTDGAYEFMSSGIGVEVSYATALRWENDGKAYVVQRLYGLEDLR
jgi:hypothetical protein